VTWNQRRTVFALFSDLDLLIAAELAAEFALPVFQRQAGGFERRESLGCLDEDCLRAWIGMLAMVRPPGVGPEK